MKEMKKKKMAFIDLTNFKDWPMGGMLEYELAILKYLVKAFDIDIWGVSVDGKMNRDILLDGVEYPIHIFGNVKTSKRIIPNYWRGLELKNCKKNFSKDYDVVYAHTGSCLIAAEKLVDRKKTKLVYHQHGLNHRGDFSLMSLVQRPGLSMAQKAADLVFVVSDPDSVADFAGEMKNKTRAKFVAIGSPINLDRFSEKEMIDKIKSHSGMPTKNFLYTGRLSAFKNVKTLIDAMRLYVDNVNSDAVLKIAGTGDQFDNLCKQIKELHLEKNVKMLGAVPHEQVYSLLQDADVFLTASGGEGVSVSVLEAYAAGLPVVCFKVPGLEGQIKNGITGFFAAEPIVEDFYNAMVKVNEDRTGLAMNCVVEAKKYDSSIIAGRIRNAINELY